MEAKTTINTDITKNLMQNHTPNQSKKITVMEAFFFQRRNQLEIVSVMMMKNNVLLPNKVKNIDKIFIWIITNEVFF